MPCLKRFRCKTYCTRPISYYTPLKLFKNLNYNINNYISIIICALEKF